MEITVSSKMLTPFKGDKYIDAIVGYRDEPNVRVDITKLVGPLSTKLLAALEKIGDPKAMAAAGVIKLYRDTMKNPNNMRPKTLQHLVQCLRAFINQAPHLMLFSRNDADEQWLPYVVQSVVYHPRVARNDQPAYVEVNMRYYDTAKVQHQNISFHTQDIYKRTIAEMLRDKDYVLETPELMTAYEASLTYYKTLAMRTGLRVDGFKYATQVKNSWSYGRVSLEVDGRPAVLVIDDEDEDEDGNSKQAHRSTPAVDSGFWGRSNFGEHADPKKMQGVPGDVDEEGEPVDDEDESPMAEHFQSKENIAEQSILRVPMHPYITCFDLRRHMYVDVHAENLHEYEYDTAIGDKLVLDDNSKELVGVLIEHAAGNFEDIVKGKAGGSIILCAGSPGTGKTLTAEVYAEIMKRPLYTVQCSQLGLEHETLEKELKRVMSRAMRWKAILLLDEADVYIHDRGSDVEQNAIVGIFLRVLEYYNGVMFMTTNRPDDIDDAIASRATAKLVYKKPDVKAQFKLWLILSKGSKIPMDVEDITKIVEKHDDLTGRDIKNLLKLATMLAMKRGGDTITPELITYVRQFKQA